MAEEKKKNTLEQLRKLEDFNEAALAVLRYMNCADLRPVETLLIESRKIIGGMSGE